MNSFLHILKVSGLCLMVFCSVSVSAKPKAAIKMSTRVQLISGELVDKSYHTRLEEIRALKKGVPLSDEEQAALFEFLRSHNRNDPLPEMELATIKNDVAAYLLRMPLSFDLLSKELLVMQSDIKQSPTWRNYCIQFLGKVHDVVENNFLRSKVCQRLFQIIYQHDPECCGVALIALSSLSKLKPIETERLSKRAIEIAADNTADTGLRYTALQIAADLKNETALPLARNWLANENNANLKAVSIGILGKRGTPADLNLIKPHTTSSDPRIRNAASYALKK